MNIHNDFFITTLKDKKNAQDFLKEALPKEITSLIDFNNLEYCDNSYIQPDFKNYFSDMVLKTTIQGKATDIYFLLEHKSAPPKGNSLFLQILSYIFAMFQEDYKNKSDFRIILPLVFYHGVQKWNIPTEFKDLFDISKPLKENILNFNYTLYDTANLDLENADFLYYNLKLKTYLIALKSAFNKKDLDSVITILNNLYKLGAFKALTDFEPFIIYILYTKEISKEKLLE
ncbi:MAG: Rpn family recombination-promoting nuclease/putative transposase, partial [Peptococcia bacterium]